MLLQLGLLLVVVAILLAGVSRPWTAGFAPLAASIVLLPADLVLPNGVTPLPTLTRVVVLAVAAGLLLRHRRVFGLTPVHLAGAAFALTTLITGVVLAPPGVRARDAALDWVSLVEPLAVFVVALAALRAADDGDVALRVLRRVTVAAVVIALLERASGVSWGQLLGSDIGRLEIRAGEPRVRVGSEFALAFAWTLGALLPAALAATPRRRLTQVAVFTGCLLAAVWSYSRTAPIAFAAGLGLLVLGNRDRRVAVGAATAAAGLGAVFLSAPAVSVRFARDIDVGAIAVRTERLPVVLEAAAERPLQGIGLSGTNGLGIPTTDNSFVLAYVETGVLGAVLLLLAVGCGLVCAGRGLLAPAGPHRASSAAAVAGAAVLVLGGVVFDALQVRGTADLLWLLLAVGVAASERSAGRQALLRPWRDVPAVRGALVAAALVTGLVVAYAWPAHTAITVRFETLPSSRLASETDDPVDEGRRLVATTCAVAEQYSGRDDGVRLDCRDLNGAAGQGELRVQAGGLEPAAGALVEIEQIVSDQTRVTDLRFRLASAPARGTPSLIRTAPVWLPLSVLLLVLLVPSGPLRRLEHRLAGTGGGPRGVDGEDVRPGPGGEAGPTGRFQQDVDERAGEGLRGRDHERV